jgi:predicted nucleic acid-binding protein
VAKAPRPAQGLIDTSVVIDLDHLDATQLPTELGLSAVTMAELSAGPPSADAGKRARRQDRLQRAEANVDPLPFDSDSARAYGRVYAAIAGRKAGGSRAVDLLIAATAVAADLPLYTRNVADFHGLEHLLPVVGIYTTSAATCTTRGPLSAPAPPSSGTLGIRGGVVDRGQPG